MAEMQMQSFRFSPIFVELLDTLRQRLCREPKSKTAFIRMLVHKFAFEQLMAAIERGDLPESTLGEPLDNRDPDAAMLVLIRRIADKAKPQPTNPTMADFLATQGWTSPDRTAARDK